MPKGDRILLRHMLDAARKARDFAKGRSRADLDSDEMLALAIIRLLEIIGEAARNLSQDIRDSHPEIAWRQITGTRDRLIHGYPPTQKIMGSARGWMCNLCFNPVCVEGHCFGGFHQWRITLRSLGVGGYFHRGITG